MRIVFSAVTFSYGSTIYDVSFRSAILDSNTENCVSICLPEAWLGEHRVYMIYKTLARLGYVIYKKHNYSKGNSEAKHTGRNSNKQLWEDDSVMCPYELGIINDSRQCQNE